MAMKHQDIIKERKHSDSKNVNFIVYNSHELFEYAEQLASVLRRKDIPIDYDLLKRSFSKQIAEAENRKSKNIIILKEDEIKKEEEITVRNTSQNKYTRIKVKGNFDALVKELSRTDGDEVS